MIVLQGNLVEDFFNQVSTVNDPRNAEAISLIEQIVEGESSGGGGGAPSAGGGSNFQLYQITPYLKGYLFYQRNKWLVIGGASLALIGSLTLAYQAGKRKGRHS